MVIVSVVTLIIMYMDLHLNAQTAKITEELIEFQAGKLFNQAANSSTKTPSKHKEFAPHDADIINEIRFP